MHKHLFFFFFCFVVISAPPVARPLYYSTSPVSVDPSTCGSVSPARKTASVLEPNPGIKIKPAITPKVAVIPRYCTTSHTQHTVSVRVKISLCFAFKCKSGTCT